MSELHVGFTGTQQGMTAAQLSAFYEQLPQASFGWWLHNGDCVGSDLQAAQIAYHHRRWSIWLHPPVRPEKRAFIDFYGNCDAELPYLDRDRVIVEKAQVLIATPKGHTEEQRSGTWYTIRYARRLQKPVMIITPDGRITRERWIKGMLT